MMGQSEKPITKRLLFFSHENWDEIWRRNQFICAGLLDRHPELQILWVTRPTDLWRFNKQETAKNLQWRIEEVPEYPRMSVLRPSKLLPNIIGRILNDWFMRAQLECALKSLGWTGKKFNVWANNELARIVMPLEGMDGLIYDITDDWTKASLPKRALDRAVADENWYLANADKVIVCSEGLYRSRQGRCKHLTLIPNGVQFERYQPGAMLGQGAQELKSMPGTIAGYVGTLHEDRLDMELLCKSIEGTAEIQFVFVGPNALSADSNKALSRLPNCHILGARPYEQIPSFYQSFNVLIVPHRVTEFTESLDPLKLYEYMATGKPVVSTPCSGFRELKKLVRIAKDNSEFVEALRNVELNDTNEDRESRIRWASEHSWEKRLEEIEKVLAW